MRKEVKIIRDMKSIKVCVEETRSKILSLLMVKDMSISQLAKALDRDQSTIYRHLKKLQDAGYVEICGERKEHHIPEKLYGRTASFFLLSPSDDDPNDGFTMEKWQKKHTEKVVRILKNIGYEFDDPELVLDELASFFGSLSERANEKFEAAQHKIEGLDPVTYFRLRLIIFLDAIMNDDEFEEDYERIVELLKEDN